MDSLLNNLGITTSEFFTPVTLSLQVALVAMVVVFVLGTATAYLMTKKEFKGKILLETLFLLPIVLPPTVIGFILLMIFGSSSVIGSMIVAVFDRSLIFTWYAAVIASTVVAFPLMYQAAKVGFLGVDKSVQEQAQIDGASNFQVFYKITLPLVSTALISGAILSFARAIGEFGATLMIAGNIPGRTQTLPTAIYVEMQSGNYTLVWLWVVSIILISFVMLFIVRKMATSSNN